MRILSLLRWIVTPVQTLHYAIITETVMGVAGLLLSESNAEESQNIARNAVNKQMGVAKNLQDIGTQEWELYKEHAIPQLIELSKNAKTTDRTEEEIALAANDTKTQYAGARQALTRRLEQTGSPADPSYGAQLARSYGAEASDVSRAITDARRRERARVEDTDWGRRLQAISAFQRLPTDATANLSGASAANYRAGAGALDSARFSQNQQMMTAYGLTRLGGVAARAGEKWYGSTPASSGGGYPSGGNVESGDTYYDPNLYGQDYTGAGDYATSLGGLNFREGGAIRPRYAAGGPIEGPGTGTSDSIPAKVEQDSYILSADTVRAIGTKKVKDLVEKAGVRPDGRGGDDVHGIQVRLSKGEYHVPPAAVKFYGEEFFNKMQQKYHRPVMSDDGMANGGAIRKRGLPMEVENAIFGAMPTHAIMRRRN